MDCLARYIIRASFSLERMTYLPDEAKVICRFKNGKSDKTFDAPEWLAAMCSHLPNKGEQTRLPWPIEPFFEILDKRISDDRKKQHGC